MPHGQLARAQANNFIALRQFAPRNVRPYPGTGPAHLLARPLPRYLRLTRGSEYSHGRPQLLYAEFATGDLAAAPIDFTSVDFRST